MPALRTAIIDKPVLRERLFQIEFLTSTTEEALVTLIYHKALSDDWEASARALAKTLHCRIIGRSRKQKVVLNGSSISETLNINDSNYHYRYYEQGFTQPNAAINIKMIEWVSQHFGDTSRDLIELYCGLGNFTLPLSQKFRRVLATEVAKSSVHAAHENIELNNIENIAIARLNAAETAQALRGERAFKRLAALPHALGEYDFAAILVDPPRAGLDEDSLRLAQSINTIAYISCNPETLARDLEPLTQTHTIDAWAVFDQFPYTHHTECGVILSKRP
jgi:tRNA (uracil-5-)-methyltransferase